MGTKMKSTSLSGTDYPVTETSYAQALWSLRRYSSFTYIAQMYRLMASFVSNYDKHCISKGASAIWMRDVFGQLYGWQGRLEKGLARLRLGDRSAYWGVLEGLGFGPYLESPRFEYGRDFGDIVKSCGSRLIRRRSFRSDSWSCSEAVSSRGSWVS